MNRPKCIDCGEVADPPHYNTVSESESDAPTTGGPRCTACVMVLKTDGYDEAHHERLVRDARIAIRAVVGDAYVSIDQIADSMNELIDEIENSLQDLEKDEERFGEV